MPELKIIVLIAITIPIHFAYPLSFFAIFYLTFWVNIGNIGFMKNLIIIIWLLSFVSTLVFAILGHNELCYISLGLFWGIFIANLKET